MLQWSQELRQTKIMRPKTHLPIPNPSGRSEFQNFDRLVKMLMPKARKPKCKKTAKKKHG